MRHFLSYVLVAVALCAAPSWSCAAGSFRATRKAEQWIGHDASELLLQLRVDGNSLQIEEIEATGETRYTWVTEIAAHYSTVVTGTESRMVGMLPNGPGGGPTPIMRDEPTSYGQVFRPAVHRCTVTFTADAQGIVRRWDYQGEQCGWDVKPPK